MTAFYIWIGVASLLFILEVILSSSFALLCFAVGSIAAALVGLFGYDEVWQIMSFAASSLLLFVFIRPLLIKRLDSRSQSRPKTNAEALIGRTAKVVEPIEANHFGRVTVDGDNWQAVSSDNTPINICENVIIESIDSIILTVKRINEAPTNNSSIRNH